MNIKCILNYVFSINIAAPSIDHMRDYKDSMNMHYSSGIYSKAWCTLKNTKGWGYIKAFEVIYYIKYINLSYEVKVYAQD